MLLDKGHRRGLRAQDNTHSCSIRARPTQGDVKLSLGHRAVEEEGMSNGVVRVREFVNDWVVQR